MFIVSIVATRNSKMASITSPISPFRMPMRKNKCIMLANAPNGNRVTWIFFFFETGHLESWNVKEAPTRRPPARRPILILVVPFVEVC
jgi:hypothetical protein